MNKERKVLLGTSHTNVNKLGIAIANELNNHGVALVRSVGQPAGYQTLKAVAAASNFDFFKGKRVLSEITFESVKDQKSSENRTITSVRFELTVADK